MNAGYLSYILICMVITLLLSGWKQALVRNISSRVLFCFFLGWFIGFKISIPVGDRLVSGIYVLLILLWLFLLLSLSNEWTRIRTMLSAMLIGLYYFLSVEAATSFPWFPFSVNATLVTVITVMVIGITRQVNEQLTIVTGALLFGALLQGYAETHLQGMRITPRLLADHWWLFMVSIRAVSVLLQYFLTFSRHVYRYGIELWKERKYK